MNFQKIAARFESDVISDGTQTNCCSLDSYHKFESDVISDGTQTTPAFSVISV